MGLFNTNNNVQKIQQNAKRKKIEKANSNEEVWRRILTRQEEAPADKKTSFEKTYEKLRKDILNKMGIDIDSDVVAFNKLPSYEEAERILRIKKRFIEHTLFNQDAFPKGTRILYFDDVFNELYASASDYYADRDSLSSRVQNYLKNNGFEHVCLKLGAEDFLYFYPNSINDSIDGTAYNISLTDKNNIVKEKIVYEENGETCGNKKNLQQILEIEVDFLDLAPDKQFREIGDVSPERYTNYRYSEMERMRVKRDILIDIYESKRYTKDQYEIIKGALKDDIDIGYILHPSFSKYQMRAILKYLDDYKNNPQFLANLRKFSTDVGKVFKKPFGDCEFLYIMNKCLSGRMDDWTSPTTIAEMKINYYKDVAYSSVTNDTTFVLDGHYYILTKNHDKHSNFDYFKLEEAIWENGNIIDKKFVYEIDESGVKGSLDEVINLLKNKYHAKDNADILKKAIADAKEANVDASKQSGYRILDCKDGAKIQIVGFDKGNIGDSLMASLFGGDSEESTMENTGITVTIFKDGKEKIVYSDDENLGITTTLEELQEIVDSHGELIDNEVFLSTALRADFPKKEDKLNESILRDNKYKYLAETNLDKIKSTVVSKNKHFLWHSVDKSVALKFEPSVGEIDENTKIKDMNVYAIEDEKIIPIYTHNVITSPTGEKFEKISGSMDDVLNYIASHNFELLDYERNPYRSSNRMHSSNHDDDGHEDR